MQVVEEAVVKGEACEGLSKSPAHAVKQSKKNKKKKKKKSKKIVAKFSVVLQQPTKNEKVPSFAATFYFRQLLGVI